MGWTIRDVLGDESEKKRVKAVKTVKTVKKNEKSTLDSQTESKERVFSLSLRGENLPTGIELLDKNLNGGFPKGSLVCIYADPAASPEAFLYQFSTERITYYVNATRPVSAIKKDFASLNLDDSLVNFIDIYSFYFQELQNSPEEVDLRTIDHALKEIQELRDEEINVVIDNLNFFLELKVEDHLKEIFLNALYSIPKTNSGLTFIYVVKDSLDTKSLNKIFDLSDILMEIFIEISGSRYVKKFGIPKIRGRTPLNDLFKFEIGEGIHLDTSRDIA